MNNILITGATGTIGAYSALYLKERGHKVIASGRRRSNNGFFREYGIDYHSLDITDSANFEKLNNYKIDAVLHAAGIMPAVMEGYQPQKYVDSIVSGTLNVLEFMKNNNIPKIIFTQSLSDTAYLWSKTPTPADAVKKFPPNNDHSVYVICKNAAVDLIEHYHYKFDMKRFVLRLPTIYAYNPKEDFFVDGKKKPVAYKFLINKAIKGEPIEVWGDKTRVREITYIDDLCQIIEKAILSQLEGGMYNVGRGVGVSLEEQILGIIEVFSSKDNKSKLIYRPDMPNTNEFVHDISKTQTELGYNPEFDYLKLLKAIKQEMQLQRFKTLWGTAEEYPPPPTHTV